MNKKLYYYLAVAAGKIIVKENPEKQAHGCGNAGKGGIMASPVLVLKRLIRSKKL